jgi:hypothetical protein
MNEVREKGSISGLFVCLVVGLLSITALVFDGGKVVQTYDELSTLAADTARIGGQQIVGIPIRRTCNVSVEQIQIKSDPRAPSENQHVVACGYR